MKHWYQYFAAFGVLALWGGFLLAREVGPFFPPDYTWSEWASDWGSLTAGMAALGAALMTINAMRAENKQILQMQSAQEVRVLAADCRNQLEAIRWSTHNSCQNLGMLITTFDKVFKESEPEVDDPNAKHTQAKRALRAVHGFSFDIPNIPPFAIGHFPAKTRHAIGACRENLQHMTSVAKQPDRLTSMLINDYEGTLRSLATRELIAFGAMVLIEDFAEQIVENGNTIVHTRRGHIDPKPLLQKLGARPTMLPLLDNRQIKIDTENLGPFAWIYDTFKPTGGKVAEG